VIDFDSAMIWFDCARCGGTGEERVGHGRDLCEGCDGVQEHAVYIGTLLANLAVAGALCEAFEHGLKAGAYYAVGNYKDPAPWWPNTSGHAMPGGES
jgi:hypothetical protein